MEAPRRRLDVVRAGVTVGGLGLIAVGLAGFDWRIAAVACGVLLIAAGVADAREKRAA